MKAYEFSTRVTSDGKVELPDHLKDLNAASEIRVIVLVAEPDDAVHPDEHGRDDAGFSAESFRKSWQQAVTGQTLPISQLWEGINVD